MKEGKSLLAGEEVTREGQEGSAIITVLEELCPARRGSAETWRGKALATVFSSTQNASRNVSNYAIINRALHVGIEGGN